MRTLNALCALALLAACAEAPAPAPRPEPAAESTARSASQEAMAVTANPHATDAAAAMLAEGGHAVDAAIAAHAVLGLVEPQSSGLGGSAFLLVFEADESNVTYFDGRETAPSTATIDMFMEGGEAIGYLRAWQSGLSVGVPGTVAMYKLAHERYGKLPWARLFEPAIDLAANGFEVSPRLAGFLPGMAERTLLDEHADTAAYFYPGGAPLEAGDLLVNPEYAETLRSIAREGISAFYEGEIAEEIVAAVGAEPDGGRLTVADMAAYRAVEREPVCGPFRDLTICGAAPPSSGAIQIMMANLYDRLAAGATTLDERIVAFVDAQRLAYADRDHYFGDPDFVDVPVDALLDPEYLDYRAMNPVPPGEAPSHGDPAALLQRAAGLPFSADTTVEAVGTSHLSIVDAGGNVASLTASVGAPFGNSRWVGGFLLNNELTDFARDVDAEGAPSANAIRPGARPRSSMSPTILLDADDEFLMATGSPGGSSILAYTQKSILGVLDWGLTVQEAVDFPNIIARGERVRVETVMAPGPALAAMLEARGYPVQERDGENSGIHLIYSDDGTLVGAADMRREGTVERVP